MEHIGRYRLIRRLGAGAFATVWLAQDDDLEIPVAIKVLADNWSSNADIRERFLAEARLLRRISDPRVVRVHDLGVVEGQPYFVMDYVEGGTLQDVLDGGTTAEDAVRLGAEAAYAVQVLHDHHVVHRDIKPSNLLLHRSPGRPSTVLVTDLGMAKSLAEASGLTVTAGTPAYMAPEQVQGSEGFDARADVYAVAAVTYALLAGHPPFAVQSVTEVLTRDRWTPPPEAAGPRGLPVEVDALLGASLSFDPAPRPRSAVEFGDQLMAAAGGRPAGRTDRSAATVMQARPPSLPGVDERQIRRWSASRVAALALLSFLAFGAATWVLLHR